MSTHPTENSINAIVELIEDCDQVYEFATAPARARVQRFEEDRYGYEKVFVVWDRDHWRHNGEDDRWAYASYFRAIEEPVQGKEPDTDEVRVHEEEMLRAAESASEVALSGEGFLMVSLDRDEDGEMFPKFVISAASDDAERFIAEELLPLFGISVLGEMDD